MVSKMHWKKLKYFDFKELKCITKNFPLFLITFFYYFYYKLLFFNYLLPLPINNTIHRNKNYIFLALPTTTGVLSNK